MDEAKIEREALKALERLRTADTPKDVPQPVAQPSEPPRPSCDPHRPIPEGARWRMEIEDA